MSIGKTIAQWLFILCLPVLLLTASLSTAMNCRALYTYGFNRYDISQVTGLAPEELKKAADGLIHYFNSGEEYINLTVIKDGQPFTLFNEREVQHLKDVKGLFRLVYKLLMGTLIYGLLFASLTLALRQDRRRLAKGLLFGSGLTLMLMLALGLYLAVDFDGFFLEFHLLSFANDFWQLNPATDYLIMLFPEGFWFIATLVVAIGTAAGALILGGLGWWRLKKEGPFLSP
jgi:integral membrane protein (TIGR01906 family)